MTKKHDIKIEMTYLLYANPQAVYEALTSTQAINHWCEGGGKLVLAKGGEVQLFGEWMTGEVLDFKKNKMLSYTWKAAEWAKKSAPSVVTFQLQPHTVGCEVKLVHENFPDMKERDKHEQGWVDHFFEPLNDYLVSQLNA